MDDSVTNPLSPDTFLLAVDPIINVAIFFRLVFRVVGGKLTDGTAEYFSRLFSVGVPWT